MFPRLSRRTYWLLWIPAFLGYVLTGAVVVLIHNFVVDDWRLFLIPGLYLFLVAVPLMTVATARRMHDVDKSAWFALVPVVNLVLAARPGTRGANRFGEDPNASLRPDLAKIFE